jgi:hypothetical protein
MTSDRAKPVASNPYLALLELASDRLHQLNRGVGQPGHLHRRRPTDKAVGSVFPGRRAIHLAVVLR